MNSQIYSIQEASQSLNIPVETIRSWAKKGLIKKHQLMFGTTGFSLAGLAQLKRPTSCRKGGCFGVLRAHAKTQFSVVELFAGAGGMALGFENAGLKAKHLIEVDHCAADTLKLNRAHWDVICDDVANIHYRDINADIVAGGFPCQAFSSVGKKLGFEDTRGTLFFEFARAVKEIQPKVFVAENVRGLVNHNNGKTLSTMLEILSALGYDVSYRICRAQYLDVPQKRERLIILGTQKRLKLKHIFPREHDYIVSLREALQDVPASAGQLYNLKKHAVMSLVPEGGNWRSLPVAMQKAYMGKSFYSGGGKTSIARRLAWSEPSLTLLCSPAQKQTERCHPSETRPLTIREYARIQTFPDDWAFTGSVSNQYKQIGNAVPVNLAFHIGRCLIEMLSTEQ